MALTKIGKEGITGISNASNATAITITSGELVGIGTTSPDHALLVRRTDGDNKVLELSTGDSTATMNFSRDGNPTAFIKMLEDGSSGTGALIFGTGSSASPAERMRIASSGKVGIGITDPQCMLHLSGGNEEAKIKFQVGTANADKFKIYASTAGRLYVNSDNGNTGVYLTHNGTSWTGNSDETLKENITSLGTVGDKLKNYRTSYFNWKAETDTPPRRNIGFIAQDWETDFPEVLTKKEGEPMGMQYTETIPILLKYIQELEARITALEA